MLEVFGVESLEALKDISQSDCVFFHCRPLNDNGEELDSQRTQRLERLVGS
jgi:hypothetical protein